MVLYCYDWYSIVVLQNSFVQMNEWELTIKANLIEVFVTNVSWACSRTQFSEMNEYQSELLSLL